MRWLLAIAVGVLVLAVPVLLQRIPHRTGESIETAASRAPSGAADGFNVLFVTLDTVRADHLGCYGYQAARTPNLDALAASGIRFARAISPAPITLPSHASMMTGLDAPSHGVRDNGTFRLGEGHVTLAERFHEHGYATAAFVSAYVLNRRFGLDRGFETYDDDCNSALPSQNPIDEVTRNQRSADRVTTAALAWIDKALAPSPSPASAPARPFFIWVHYYDAHHPYLPPPEFARQFPGQPYDGEISFVDAQLGRLLDRLRDPHTLIIVAADHGEGLGEHDEPTHEYLVYSSTMRVPLLMHCPALWPNPVVVDDRVVGLVDIAPTLLDLFGLPPPAHVDGRHLLQSPRDDDRAIYIETLATRLDNGWAPLHGLRRLHDKFIEAPRPEYYDMSADPGETRDLYEQSPAAAAELRARLADRLASWPSTDEVVAETAPADAETVQRLASLGYVSQPAPEGPLGTADPKDMMPIMNRGTLAEQLSQLGRHAEAVAAIGPVLAADPSNGHAWYFASSIYKRIPDYTRAESCLRRAIALSPTASGYVSLAQLLVLRRSLDDELERTLEQAKQLDASNGGIYVARGDANVLRGRLRDALADFQEALRLDPTNFGQIAREKITWVKTQLGS